MAKYPTGLLEEELKNKVAADWFAAYDTTRIIGKVDFCVAVPATELGLYESENALWAEAKAGVRKDIHESFVQLILTIGRARTFDTERPPLFLGAFDAEKIAFLPYDLLKQKYALYDRDFYLAELNVDDNGTVDVADDRIANDFYISFNANERKTYRVQRTNADELSFEMTFGFKSDEGLAAYAAFWRRYKRPPRKEYWNYIVKRLDLLVPQDVRERKGAFFTPQKWVELSQEYLACELGENWQDEYDIWDCCAGTGNMEAGLTNKYKVWASTLDQQDVDVMKERIRNGANLLESHVFQFDFLNDDFAKLPAGLREIIDDPERRRKLVIYINHYVGEKAFYACESKRMISDWLRQFYVHGSKPIGYLSLPGVSMQQRASLFLTSKPTESDIRQHKVAEVTTENVLPCVVYLAVRHCILPEWTNNKDEFRYPNDAWKCDCEFLGDCLVWANFDNSVKSSDGPNHWIPFTEAEVDAKECFQSHFMSDFLAGKVGGGGLGQTALPGLGVDANARVHPVPCNPCVPWFKISPVAQAVLDAGRELWRYYHAQPGANPNASYYDIRRHFQGVKKTASGKEQMNATSDDATYNDLLAALKSAMKALAKQIEPKVYEYGFLKR